MFAVYLALVLVPAYGFYRFMNRDEGDDPSLFLPMAIFVIQFFLVLNDGWLPLTVATLIFLMGAFLLYGCWYLSGRSEAPGVPEGSYVTAFQGAPFTEIEFNYLDAKGDRSHRTVQVWAVDDEYFEGHCRKAEATRTFVIGRIRGKVLVHDTGELLSPREWAAQARKDPLNTENVQGRPFQVVDP